MAQLLVDLEDFQACETSQLQFYDSIGLRFYINTKLTDFNAEVKLIAAVRKK